MALGFAPQRCSYPPANSIIVPGNPFRQRAGLAHFWTIDRAKTGTLTTQSFHSRASTPVRADEYGGGIHSPPLEVSILKGVPGSCLSIYEPSDLEGDLQAQLETQFRLDQPISEGQELDSFRFLNGMDRLLRLGDECQAGLDAAHGGEIIFFHGFVMGAGVNDGSSQSRLFLRSRYPPCRFPRPLSQEHAQLRAMLLYVAQVI